jgi:hypothetical protein
MTLTSNSIYNDGWYGMSYTINDLDGNVVATDEPVGNWATLDVEICLPDGCYEVVTDYTWSGYGWSMAGVTATNGNPSTSTNVEIGSGVCPITGCTDDSACNYNPDATVDNGSCIVTVSVDLPYSGTGLTNCGSGDYVDATTSYDNGEDGVYVFTADNTGNTYIDLTTTSSWTGLFVYDGCPGSGGNIISSSTGSSGDESIILDATAGVTYYVVLSTWPTPDCIESFDLDIYEEVLGCTDGDAYNYDASANVDDASCVYAGCTNPTATNYDATATIEDGSCEFPACEAEMDESSLFVDHITDHRARFNFANMNSENCIVDQLRVRYRVVGSNMWSYKTLAAPTGWNTSTGTCNSTQATSVTKWNLEIDTDYEWAVKVWYCGSYDYTTSNGTGWVDGPDFSTLPECPNVGNFTATATHPNKVLFTWDDSNGAYEFARIKLIQTAQLPFATDADWTNVGGAGIQYGIFTKLKNNLFPGVNYTGRAIAYCQPNGIGWNSLNWTDLVTWTQPTTNRFEGGSSIANLGVYPNPSRDVFNVSFTSEDVQDLEVKVINIVGEVVYTEDLEQFVGEYTKVIDLDTYTKGVYFLEITTNKGVVNKKLILQ